MQGVDAESTSLQIPILLRNGVSLRNSTETTVISSIHSSGMNLHKVQRRKKGCLCVCEPHYLEDKKPPVIKSFKTPVWNWGTPAWRGSQCAK